MSDQEKKPREFWLGLNESVIYTKNDFVELPTKEDPGPFVHVIEHSAYEKLQKENEQLRADNEYLNRELADERSGIQDRSLEKHLRWELNFLQAKLAEAQAALEKYVTAYNILDKAVDWSEFDERWESKRKALAVLDERGPLAKLRGQE